MNSKVDLRAKFVQNGELVLGLVGALGTDMEAVATVLSDLCRHTFNYEVKTGRR